MPLDAAAAAALTETIYALPLNAAWAANMTALGMPEAVAESKAYMTALYTAIFAAIVANAVVSPVGVPPMSNSGGPVAGTGRIV